MNKICILIACHTDSLKKYFTLLNNLNEFRKFTNNIIIINSSDAKYSKNLKDDIEDFDYIIDYIEIKNDKYLDFGKWNYALKNYEKFNFKKFDSILFTNDSILIVEKLDNFFTYISNLPESINIYGYNDSSQLGIYHYQSYLFLIKTKIMNKFMNNFESKKHLIHNQESVIKHFELGIIHIDKNHDCFLKLAKEWNDQKNIFWENNELYERLLHKNIFHLLKLKKIQDFIKFYVYDKEKIRDYFDVEFYRNTYNDLNNFSDEELFHHYLGYGVDEGRNCILNQYKVFPEIYSNKLQNCKLENLFNVPSSFDIYLYKTENKSMSNCSNIDILNHYDNHARENEDIILKNGFNNAQLFKEMYIYYIKLFFNIQVKLDNKFTYNKLLHYNKDLINKGLLKNIIFYSYKNDLIPNEIKINKSNNDLNNKSNNDLNNESNYKFNNNINNINNLNNLNNENNLEMNNMEINWIKKLIPIYKKSSDEEIKKFIDDNRHKIRNIDIKYLNYYKETNHIFYYNSEYVKYHYKYVGSLKENDPFLTFNPSIYKILNKRIPNLLNMSNSAAKEHYFTIGYKQNLSYEITTDFHPIIYKYLHIDEFKHMNKKELIEHYLHFGHYEKRNYKFEYFFNLEAFKIIYKKKENDEEKLINDYVYNYYKKKKIKMLLYII